MKLIDYKEDDLWRGTIFRFKGQYPFEEIVDFMLADVPFAESGYAVICISGYYAGFLEVNLPKEAKSANAGSISRRWLIENWNKWVYPDCSVNDVLILEAETPKSFSPD